MPRFREVLAINPYRNPTEFVQEAEPANVDGSAISKSFWQEQTTRERWYAKSDVCQEDYQAETSAFLESCANKIYAYYGITVARLAITVLPTSCDLRLYGLPQTRATATHLLSRWVDRFNCYGEQNLPPFTAQTTIFHLKIEEQKIPEQGLGHILAIAHFINDIDVIGGSGKNIGYKLISVSGELRALSCKIDPGYAFYKFDELSIPPITRNIQYKTVLSSKHEAERQIEFDSLPQQTKLEFIATLRDIVVTPVGDLGAIFQHCSNPQIQPRTANIIRRLQERQQQLRTVFGAELSTVSTKEHELNQTITRLHKLILETPNTMLQQMHAHNLFANQNPLYQQAKEFYIELSAATEPYNLEHPPRNFPLYGSIQRFLQNPQKIFVLLGDCGTGKSTFTKKLKETLWDYIDTTQQVAPNQQIVPIPIHIELQRFSQRTIPLCVQNTLIDDYKLTISQINELKRNYNCLIILDGFDEIEGGLKDNFWHTNELNSWRNAKLLITSRPEHLISGDIDKYFSVQIPNPQKPQELIPDQNSRIVYYLTPFSETEIKRYLTSSIPEYNSYWSNLLSRQPDLLILLNTPLLLKIFRKACPLLSTKTTTELTRFELYEVFMEDWFKSNKTKLEATLGRPVPHILQAFEEFSQELAFTMYQQSKVVISRNDIDAWSRFFDPSNDETTRARLGCPLRRSSDDYSFIHKSFYEYFLAKHVLYNFNSIPPGTASSMLCKEPESANFFISLIKTINPPPSITSGIFLELIGYGRQDLCETMLQLHPELATIYGSLTDCGLIDYNRPDLGNRIFHNITAFQYAVLALDYHMWTMLLKYLKPNDARAQLIELEQKAILTKDKGWIIRREAGVNWPNISWLPLIGALNNYAQNYNSWSADECGTYWRQQVGGPQLILPAHIINEYSHPYWNNSSGIALPRTGVGDWRTGGEGNKLGNSFAWLRRYLLEVGWERYAWTGVGEGYAMSEPIDPCFLGSYHNDIKDDHDAMDKLFKSRTQLALSLVSQLKAIHTERHGVTPKPHP